MRKVVVKQEAAFDFALLEIIHELFVFLGSQRSGYQRLSFTTCKQSRTVNARQPANFAAYRTNFREAASIGASSLVEYIVAEDSFLQVIENLLRHLSLLNLILRIRFDDFFLQRINGGIAVAFFLAGRIQRRPQAI